MSENDLPLVTRLAPVVPLGDTFLVLRGRGSNLDTATFLILEFQPDTETWEYLPLRMETPRSSFFALFVDKSDHGCK